MGEGKIYRRARSKFWQLRWTDSSGAEIRLSSGTEDYKEAAEKLRLLSSGSLLYFADVAIRFLTEHKMRAATHKGYSTSLRAWKPYLGSLLIQEVNESHIKAFVSDRLSQVKEGTIRNDLAFLSSLFTFAQMLPHGPTTNPVDSFNKRHLKPSAKRVRWLTDDQVELLLSNIIEARYRLIVLFGLEAGLRRSEILNLRVWQIDRHRHKILLRPDQTKADEGRSVPISQALRRALYAHMDETKPTNYLILNPDTDEPYVELRPWWPDALRDARIRDFTFHDTRHHFASRYVMRGGRIQVLSKLLGHASVQMTERYAFLEQSDAHDEFERLDKT